MQVTVETQKDLKNLLIYKGSAQYFEVTIIMDEIYQIMYDTIYTLLATHYTEIYFSSPKGLSKYTCLCCI